MHSFENLPDHNIPAQPLQHTVELLSNLIYLSRCTDTHSNQQHRYLDWAAGVLEELRHHPILGGQQNTLEPPTSPTGLL